MWRETSEPSRLEECVSICISLCEGQSTMLFTSCISIGFFFEPTVFTDVQDHIYIAVEESFGPVMIISKFSNGLVEISYFYH